MRHRNILTTLCFAAVSLLAQVICQGQSNYAALNGTVFDPQQQVIPGAELKLTAVSTRAVRQVRSNEQGTYQITGLLPGDYQLEAQTQGFARWGQTMSLEVG